MILPYRSQRTVVESLHRLGPAETALALQPLRRDVLLRMLAYADQYRPGKRQSKSGLYEAVVFMRRG